MEISKHTNCNIEIRGT